MTVDFVLIGIILLAVGVVFVLMQSLVGTGRQRTWDRLSEEGLAESRFPSKVGGGKQARFSEGLAASLAAQIPQPADEAARLGEELTRAGYYRPTARRNYLAIRNALTVAPLIATGAVLALWVPASQWLFVTIGTGLVMAGLGYALPRFYLRSKGNRRVARIERSLPDATDMLTMCVTGGMSMPEALQRVSGELGMAHQDLALELAIVRRHTELSSLVQGLQQFARRIGTGEVRSLTTLLIQSEHLGTDVVRALEDYTDNLRRQRRQRAEERANRASVKMLFPIVLCLAPSVFILLVGPAALELRNFLVNERRPGGVLSQETFESARSAAVINPR